MAAAEQQLAERERSKQAAAAEAAEKQHALQVTRGECAAAQDRLSQVRGLHGFASSCHCSKVARRCLCCTFAVLQQPSMQLNTLRREPGSGLLLPFASAA
jgi:hypothetical protein